MPRPLLLKSLVTSILMGLLILIMSCSSVRTRYDYDPGTDFATWKTWDWYEEAGAAIGDPRLDNPLIHARVVAAVDRTLAELGLERAAAGAVPDMLVNYHLSLDQRLQMRTVNSSYTTSSRRHGWNSPGWSGVGWTETRVEEVEEGTLVIDLVDVGKRQLAWRGRGTRRLSRNSDASRITSQVNEAVDEILRRFPPGS